MLYYILHDLVGWAASAYHHETRMKPAPKGPVSMLDCYQPMLG
ncbi:hypothetical protein [Paracoccus actinidiae]|nr:hypothetical protein [Paracoccus sp. M09]